MKLYCFFSSSELGIDDRPLITNEDLEHLCQLVERKDGGPPWKHMMDRSGHNMSYQAWQRDPEVLWKCFWIHLLNALLLNVEIAHLTFVCVINCSYLVFLLRVAPLNIVAELFMMMQLQNC